MNDQTERCRDCGAPWRPVRRGECSRCGSDAGPQTEREAQAVYVGNPLPTTPHERARRGLAALETPAGFVLGDVIARLVLDSGIVRPAVSMDEMRDGIALGDADQAKVAADLRDDLEAAEARVRELEAALQQSRDDHQGAVEKLRDYEHRIAWDTTCGQCATTLDNSIREYERAGLAVEKLRAVEADADLGRAIRTLLPGLRVANYVERWSPASPAVRALGVLCRFVGEDAPQAGDLIDPDVPTRHQRRPEGNPVESDAEGAS
jgi:hypothetical protein